MDHHVVQLALLPPPQRGSASAAATPSNGDARRLEMCPSLYRAAHHGQAEEVMALLLQPQHGAAGGDHQVSGIIQHEQCSLLEVTAERNTILHVVAEQGHGELIQELYHRFIKDNSGFLSRQNSALDTPLHCAARAGHAGAITMLVHLSRECGENILLGCQNTDGDTALHLAARHGHDAAVEALVMAHVSASELNKAGVSALYLAVMSRSVQAVRAIITTEASSVGPSSQNALHAAVFQRDEKSDNTEKAMVHDLLEWNPELASQVDCNGSTPLHFAASDGNLTVVKAILEAAPPTTVYMKDSDGISALHVAARLGHIDIVRELIRIYPDATELRDHRGETFLHAAAKEKQASVVSLAIKNPMLRGLLNAQDGDGNTPLHLAVAVGTPDVVEALLRKGKVRADVLNNDGQTPLDLASKSTSLFIMISLVVTLVAFRAQGSPQRLDHLKPWSGRDMVEGIEKTSDSLALIAVLIATAAFAAGFNMPGGYGDKNGRANLEGIFAFKCFLVLDSIAIAASVIAVILLAHGKASRFAGSWKSFMAALHFIWVSLLSLILALYSVCRAVTTSRAVIIMYWTMYTGICILVIWISKLIETTSTVRTVWRFMRRNHRANAINRQYPFAGTSVSNLLLFVVLNFIAYVGLLVVSYFGGTRLSSRAKDKISPAFAPISENGI